LLTARSSARFSPDCAAPHSGSPWRSHACSAAWRAVPFARPSIVLTRLPTTAATGVMQERVALPSTCTVHAPHCAMPQPYFVPVSPTCSRRAHSNGVLGSTFTSLDLPLIVRRAMAFLLLGSQCRHYPLAR